MEWEALRPAGVERMVEMLSFMCKLNVPVVLFREREEGECIRQKVHSIIRKQSTRFSCCPNFFFTLKCSIEFN